ncbi:hypothetical protein COCOBI_04-5680 [Coccomyxa sp. Obi]|nr:hypothetical protein COCOBI_04-5680 [Coccomyxa sp. Obi]
MAEEPERGTPAWAERLLRVGNYRVDLSTARLYRAFTVLTPVCSLCIFLCAEWVAWGISDIFGWCKGGHHPAPHLSSPYAISSLPFTICVPEGVVAINMTTAMAFYTIVDAWKVWISTVPSGTSTGVRFVLKHHAPWRWPSAYMFPNLLVVHLALFWPGTVLLKQLRDSPRHHPGYALGYATLQAVIAYAAAIIVMRSTRATSVWQRRGGPGPPSSSALAHCAGLL